MNDAKLSKWVFLAAALASFGCGDVDGKSGDPWWTVEQDEPAIGVEGDDDPATDTMDLDEPIIPDVVRDPDAPDAPDTPDPPDVEGFDIAQIIGTRWGSVIEGSVGTYLTWRELADSGRLAVDEEAHYWDQSPPEITGTSVGDWTIDDGVVSMSWRHLQYNATYEESRTWALVSGDLAEVMQTWTAGVATDGVEFWLAGGLRRISTTTYRGVWQSNQFYDDYRSLRRVETTVDYTPSPCRLTIELSVSHEQSDEVEEGVESFDFACVAHPLGEDGWTEIDIEGYDDDLSNSWNELLNDRDVTGRFGYRAQRLMASHFVPRLYLDPSGDLMVHQSSSEVWFDQFQRPGEF